jgi:CDP-diacylglycerol--glycerol-3-phosphate 3-phosphatidyltransferase
VPLYSLFSAISQGVLWFDWIVMAVALVLTVYTCIEYLVQAWRVSRQTPQAPSA